MSGLNKVYVEKTEAFRECSKLLRAITSGYKDKKPYLSYCNELKSLVGNLISQIARMEKCPDCDAYLIKHYHLGFPAPAKFYCPLCEKAIGETRHAELLPDEPKRGPFSKICRFLSKGGQG